MGVIPVGTPHSSAGHHHLMVDIALPSNPSEKVVFSNSHRHFGAGQTSTVLSLPNGAHRLRLLFADHEHRPYFAFSREVNVIVSGNRSDPPVAIDSEAFDVTCQAWYELEVTRPRSEVPAVRIANLRDDELVSSPFRVNFDVQGMGVAPKGYGDAKHGHFVLKVQSGKSPPQIFSFANGATQTVLSLAPGAATLELAFKNDAGDDDLLPPARLSLKVAPGPLAVKKR